MKRQKRLSLQMKHVLNPKLKKQKLLMRRIRRKRQMIQTQMKVMGRVLIQQPIRVR